MYRVVGGPGTLVAPVPVMVLKKTFLQVKKASHSVVGREMGHLVKRSAGQGTADRHIIPTYASINN